MEQKQFVDIADHVLALCGDNRIALRSKISEALKLMQETTARDCAEIAERHPCNPFQATKPFATQADIANSIRREFDLLEVEQQNEKTFRSWNEVHHGHLI